MCPFQSHLQTWGLECSWLWLTRATEEPKSPGYLVAGFPWDLSAKLGIFWEMVMEEQQGRSFTHGGWGGLDRLRKRCFPGGRELTGKIGCIIRPCWVPTLPSSAHNRADWALVSYREGSRVLGDVGSVPQSLKGHRGGDFVLGQPGLWLSQPVLHPVSGSRPLS